MVGHAIAARTAIVSARIAALRDRRLDRSRCLRKKRHCTWLDIWEQRESKLALADEYQPIDSKPPVMRRPRWHVSRCFAGAPCYCPLSRAHRIQSQLLCVTVRHSRFRPIRSAAQTPRMIDQVVTQSPVEIFVQKKAHLGCREC